jgi:hypothetical protein
VVSDVTPSNLAVDRQRRRLALLVRIAAAAGDFSPKLSQAVDNATDSEVRIMSDLVDRGLSVPDLVNFLQGAHLLVGDDALYEEWIFPKSRRRLSSHHRTVDKATSPDYGIDGPLVRESLHGKAASGTWVQLERTKATFQWGKAPTWSDAMHIRDYVIYRMTGKNVGPWGLSAHVDTRPMLLRPQNATTGQGAEAGLAEFASLRARQGQAEGDSNWEKVLIPQVPLVGPVGDLFGPPTTANVLDLLPEQPYTDELGPGMFGPLPIARMRVAISPEVSALLDRVSAPDVPDGSQGDAVDHVPVHVQLAGGYVSQRAVIHHVGAGAAYGGWDES